MSPGLDISFAALVLLYCYSILAVGLHFNMLDYLNNNLCWILGKLREDTREKIEIKKKN